MTRHTADYIQIKNDVRNASAAELWRLNRLPLSTPEANYRCSCVTAELQRRGLMLGGAA